MLCGDKRMKHIEGILISIVYLIFIAYAYTSMRYSFSSYSLIEVNKGIAYYILQHKYLEIEDFVQYLKNNPSVVLIKIDGETVYYTENIQSYTTLNFVFLNDSKWVEVIVGVKD